MSSEQGKASLIIFFPLLLVAAICSVFTWKDASAGFQDTQHFYGNLTGTPNGGQPYIYVWPAPSASPWAVTNAQVTVTVNNVISAVPILTSTPVQVVLSVALTPVSWGTPNALRVAGDVSLDASGVTLGRGNSAANAATGPQWASGAHALLGIADHPESETFWVQVGANASSTPVSLRILFWHTP